MINSRSFSRRAVFSIIASGALLFFVSSASADVTVERLIKFGGYFGQGAFEAKEKVSYQGQNQRTDRKQKFTGSFLSKITGESDATTIVRIKKDVIYNIDHPSKSYTEGKITPERAEEAQQGPAGDKSGKEAKNEEQKKTHRVIKNEVTVKETGEKKKINGFDCSKYIVIWELVTEEIETKTITESVMTNELWNTKTTKALAQLKSEEATFLKAYLKKLGLDMSPADMRQMGLNFIGAASGSNAKKFKKKMKKIKGYPIVTNIKWEQSSTESEGAKKEEPAGGETGMAGGFGGFLSGMAKKAMKPKNKKDGSKEVIFESYTEIKSVSTRSLAKNSFSVPADYTKGGGGDSGGNEDGGAGGMFKKFGF